MTMVGGRVVFDNGDFPGLDAEAARLAAGDAARAARLPVDPANVDRTRRFRLELGRHYRGIAALGERG